MWSRLNMQNSNVQTRPTTNTNCYTLSAMSTSKKFCIFLYLFVCIVSCSSTVSAFSPDSSAATQPPSPTPSESTLLSTTNQSLIMSGSTSTTQQFKCGQLRYKSQRKLCRETPGLKKALIHADFQAQQECEFRFQTHKWRCYSFTLLGKSNITKKASKESSFVYSLSSAILMHAIAKACSDGRMVCTADNEEQVTTDSTGHFEQKVTLKPSYIKFSEELVVKFLDGVETRGKSLSDRQRLNLHNYELGRKIVSEKKYQSCKCHGVSAGCTVQTCMMELPETGQISAELKKKYDTSVKVRSSFGNNAFIDVHSNKPVSVDSMIYFTDSLDFCFKDIALGSKGVHKNRCSISKDGGEYESCKDACCGRGYIEIEQDYKFPCCDFVWCCKVKCHTCIQRETVYLCK